MVIARLVALSVIRRPSAYHLPQGFYQNPDTYTASKTAITALGAQQEFQLGQLIRSLYFNDTTSPSHIQNISTGLFNQAQIDVRADAGGEGGVIYDSALALVQGLWPASPAFNTTLSDGTNVPGPLGGYQVRKNYPLRVPESTVLTTSAVRPQ